MNKGEDMKKSFINKPLYKLERKANLLPLIVFAIVTGALLVVAAAIFPYMEDSLSLLPEELQSLVNFNSVTEYFSAEAVEMWVVSGSIYAAWLALKLVNGDFKNGNAELLYSLNISRNEILRTKLLRLFVNVTIYNVALSVVAFLALWLLCGQLAIAGILIFTLFAWLTTLIVGLLMFGLGTVVGRKFGPVAGIVLVVLLYLISSISMSASQVEWLGYLSPFTTMFGDVISNGFAGLLNYGASLIIWGVVAICTAVFGILNFKNVDLD